jgi:hypothetical protein
MAEVCMQVKDKELTQQPHEHVDLMEEMGDLGWILTRSFDCSKHTTSEAVIR